MTPRTALPRTSTSTSRRRPAARASSSARKCATTPTWTPLCFEFDARACLYGATVPRSFCEYYDNDFITFFLSCSTTTSALWIRYYCCRYCGCMGFTQGRKQRATHFAQPIDITHARCQSCDKARSCRTEPNQEFAWLVHVKYILLPSAVTIIDACMY
jgi:hypothetical protein